MRVRSKATLLFPALVALTLGAGTLPTQAGGELTQQARPDDPTEFALSYLQQTHEDYGVSAADLGDLAVASAVTSEHNGVTHVNISQQYEGLEVFGARATVNIKDGSVLFVGQSLVPDLSAGASGTVDTSAVDAVEAAAEGLDLEQPTDLRVIRSNRAAAQETTLTDGGISAAPIPARLGWQPTDDGLRAAWKVVIDDATDVHLWDVAVDAETGAVLEVQDHTSHDDLAGLASGLSRGSGPGVAQQGGVTTASTHGSPDPVADGSSYRVYEIPKESPNDGDRTVVSNPADGTASPFGWHDTDGVSGAEFTTTRGNNVHAYLDRDNNNQPDPDQDVDGGVGLDFDFPIDLALQPDTYGPAAVTNLFYLNNVIHDVMYRYGFTEEFANFQANNYGKGGTGGDYVRAEAQDGGGTNNANFSTPANDGGTPRMQMYTWDFSAAFFVDVDPPSPAAGSYGAAGAAFGPEPDETGLSGPFALAEPSDGCGPLVGFPAGSIAIIDRGTCPFADKVSTAQAAGAVGVVMVNNVPGAPITMGGDGPITIPSVMVSLDDGNTIKAGLPATGTLRANADALQRDGDLDNGIIIHEYGHGVSLRLTGGPGINCLTGNEQMGEGWSDFLAVSMLLDPALDDPEGRRGMGTYAVFEDDRGGDGIRPRPYSRNMEINEFTYDHIKTGGWQGGSLAIPHGIGWAWATVLWDMTWDLVDRHGFNPNVYDDWSQGGNNLAIQLVIDGLKQQGCGPGFVVGRDAIIAADQALTGGDNECTLWNTFARRGLGASAIQGSTNRDDNTEAFDVPSHCAAPGAGLVGARFANPPALNVVNAGAAAPVQFNLGGNLGLDILKDAHSPASQQIDCDTLQPLQNASTVPTSTTGNRPLTYSPGQQRYQYNWKTEAGWAGTCRQLLIVLEDGSQHRAYFRFE